MIGDTTITVIGNLTAEPELKMTQSGVAVATFTIASAPRLFDRASSQWRDGDPLFLRCTIWRQPAEHVAELAKGTRVIASGRLKQHTFETREGEKRTVTELELDDIGTSLKYARARVMRVRPTAAATVDDASPPITAAATTQTAPPF
jgi:single-strand DNA-binding protein